MRFSQNYGFVPIRSIIQVDSIDEALRNSFWSLLKLYLWDEVHSPMYGTAFQLNPEFKAFCHQLWYSYFKLPLDNLKDDLEFIYKRVRTYYFECEWFEVYDLLEFVAECYPFDDGAKFVTACNGAMKAEMSAYRFVGVNIARITADEEISEIEEASQSEKDPVGFTSGAHLNFSPIGGSRTSGTQ